MRQETVLLEPRFDSRLPTYWMLSAQFVLLISVIGIPIMPFWLLFGMALHRKQYEKLECQLTERTLNIKKGVLFRTEKNIPLDKIQDVAMKEGPLLRYLGLASLSIETAGSSNPQGADAHLVGVVDAPAFRDAILDQRDEVVEGRGRKGAEAPAPATVAAAEPARDAALLGEIRDSLHRIEKLLARDPR